MGANSFNAMELDAIGEIMNISLGASATAVSTLLGTKVNITTPVAQVLSSDEFSFKRMEPAVGVNISYVKGLEGNNVMIFRRNDVRVIVGILMGAEIPEEEFVMDDEINVSAVCEVMNQMMGSSATALSEFLGYTVDISTPKSFEITDDAAFKERYFPSGTNQVLVRFTLEIGDVLKSEFMNIMGIDLIKRLLAPFADTLGAAEDTAVQPVAEPESSLIQTSAAAGEPAGTESKMPDGVLTQEEIQAMLAGGQEEESSAPVSGGGDAMLSQEEIQAMLAGGQAAEPASSGGDAMLSQEEIQAMLAGGQPETAPVPQPESVPAQSQPVPAPMQQPVYQQASAAMDPMMMQLMTQMQQSQMQMMEFMKELKGKEREPQKPRESAVIHSVNSSSFDAGFEDGMEAQENQEMLMKVPLEISVEIGRTKKKVKDILEFTQGSLVVLDKMAGEQADLYVNGQCIAKGDIVVVEDNFGIRVTEIISRNINPESL